MKRVLYAEDSVASQALMRRYLKGLCEVVIAPSPRAASSLLSSEPFSLLISDYMFPDCDATDLIVKTRESHDATKLPIIVVSSSMDKLLATRMILAGANEIAAKPLHPMEFRTLIERMLEDPYVCKQDVHSVGVAVFQWQSGDVCYQYCPDTGLRFSGATFDEASQAMFSALRERATAGDPPGIVHNAKLVTHVIDY